MRFIICFVVVGLCLLTGACVLDTDIGDYEYHLEAWNSQNMLDYQIFVEYWYPSMPESGLVTVRNGIPESGSSIPPGLGRSTVPELYSWIKEVENDKYKNGIGSFKVSYNTEYHYPNEIIWKNTRYTESWEITVMPLEEGELDIDIGDYEYHLEAWNSRNMLDYQIEVGRRRGDYGYNSVKISMDFNVKNGIPDREPIPEFIRLKKATVPEIYSLIKEDEERIRDIYNGINRSYLHVQYDAEYHYPTQISLGVDHRFGLYDRLEITFTPGETE